MLRGKERRLARGGGGKGGGEALLSHDREKTLTGPAAVICYSLQHTRVFDICVVRLMPVLSHICVVANTRPIGVCEILSAQHCAHMLPCNENITSLT